MLALTVVSLALAMQAATSAAPSGAYILRCDVATSATTTVQRTFRLAPNLFQEWKPDTKAFGPNLCASFQCMANQQRLEGTISSASLQLTIAVDPSRKSASWRTLGASGLSRTNGPCSVEPEKAQ